MMYYRFRIMLERILSLVALLVLFPFFLIVALIIKTDGGPVFFLQERLGQGAKVFRVIKFRTMIHNAEKYLDADGKPTRNRITKVGKFLRLSSIDELPQFINILKGDMSAIGPRPILPRMLPFMTDSERQRFDCLPGITGLAQAKGRNFIAWSKRFKYDAFYAKNITLQMDVFVLIQTVKVVLGAQNISLDINSGQVDDVTIRKVT